MWNLQRVNFSSCQNTENVPDFQLRPLIGHRNSRLLQQIQNIVMVGNRQRVSKNSKTRIHQGWTTNEVNTLMEVVTRLSPKNKEDWTNVCLEMHQKDFRHTVWDYKTKFNSEVAKQQRISLKQNQQQYTRICELFHEGKSPTQISTILGNITSMAVETSIKRILLIIRRIVGKVVGRSKAIQIKVKNYTFFKFLKENRLQIKSIHEMKHICSYWKALTSETNKFKKINFEKYDLCKKSLQQTIKNYNSQLRQYLKRYEQYLQQHHLRQQHLLKKNEVRKGRKTPTLASIYLMNVTQNPDNFRESGRMLSPQHFVQDQDLSRSVSLEHRFSDKNNQREVQKESKQDDFHPTMNSLLHQDPFLDHVNFQNSFQLNKSSNENYYDDYFNYIQEEI